MSEKQEEQAALGVYATAEGAREGCYTIADCFGALSNAWTEGDEKMRALPGVCGPETSGFKALVRGEYREAVDHILHVLRTDWVPATLPHLSSTLRGELQRVLRLADLDGYKPDTDGDTSPRWRQTWGVTGLEPEFEDLAMLLRAEGDGLVLKAGGTRALTPAKPSQPVPGAGSKPAQKLAHASWLWAREKRIEADKSLDDGPGRPTKADYEYIKLHGFEPPGAHGTEDYQLPVFDTWRRYVNEAKRPSRGSKQSPRTGREHGSSIVHLNEI